MQQLATDAHAERAACVTQAVMQRLLVTDWGWGSGKKDEQKRKEVVEAEKKLRQAWEFYEKEWREHRREQSILNGERDAEKATALYKPVETALKNRKQAAREIKNTLEQINIEAEGQGWKKEFDKAWKQVTDKQDEEDPKYWEHVRSDQKKDI